MATERGESFTNLQGNLINHAEGWQQTKVRRGHVGNGDQS
jgi:hypothetical protein